MGPYIVLFLILNGINLLTTVYAQAGRSCTTPNKETARCVSIYECAVLYNVVTDRNPEVVRFLRDSQCDYVNQPYVCCGSSSRLQPVTRPPTRPPTRPSGNRNGNSNLLPNRQTCGRQGADRILGGTATNYDEFPWMALLEYRRLVGGGTTFSCGGVLISTRYVLTAAHCVTGQITSKVGPLISVRLGEYDTRQGQDCVTQHGVTDCNEEPLNVGVEQAIAHSGYDDGSKSRYNDIGIVRLVADVQFTDFIQPICLPQSEAAAIGQELWVSGWGRTEYANFSPVKLKVGLPVVSNNDCGSTFRAAGVSLANTQLCAGGRRNQDSCNGDSGGPLMATIGTSRSQWYVEGIVSFGTRCGTENWPGIYTRVSQYLQWIYDNIRP